MRLHDLGEPRDPRNAFVSNVPDEPEAAAGSKHAVDLRERLVARNQWNACPTVTVHGACTQWIASAVPEIAPDTRERLLQHRAHLGDRLDRHHGRAGADQQGGQLACPGGEVKDGPVDSGGGSSRASRATAAGGYVGRPLVRGGRAGRTLARPPREPRRSSE